MRLLGFVPLAMAGPVQTRLASVGGPRLASARAGTIAALLQEEPAGRLSGRRRQALKASLLSLQQRLELACQSGPFLPMDPGAAICPPAAIADVLAAAHADLAEALARHGAQHQWDLALRWSAESVIARHRTDIAQAASGAGPSGLAAAVQASLRAERARRSACLRDTFCAAGLTFDPAAMSGGDTEILTTILVPAAAPSGIEQALQALPGWMQDGAADLRGPLPPLSFAAVRLEKLAPAAIEAAWRCLDLPASLDAEALHAIWRRRAAGAHPDRAGPGTKPAATAAFTALADAYRTLRPLLAQGGSPCTLAALRARAGLRLVMPAADASAPHPATLPWREVA
jgi:hypothetical protein